MKTLPNHIKESLSQLRAIKPEASWLEQNKQQLIASLSITAQAEQRLSYASALSMSTRDMLTRLAWQPLGTLILILGVVVGPSIAAVNAAKGSLPGDALYPVKRSLERARLSFTFSSARRAELEVDLVSTRLHELQRLTKEQAPSPERQQKIALAVEELKKDTATVKTRLDAAKQNGDTANKQQAVAIAKIVDQKTSDYQETLQAAMNDINNESAKGTGGSLTQAISSVQDVTINALDILVNDGDKASEPISAEDLKTRVEKQFSSVKQSVDAFRVQVVALNGPALDPIKVLVPNPDQPLSMIDTVVVPEKPLDPKLADLVKQLDAEIIPLITYAEELIKLQNFPAALETLTKANRKLDELSRALLPEPEPEPTPEPEVTQPTEEQPQNEPTTTDTKPIETAETAPKGDESKTAAPAPATTTEKPAEPSAVPAIEAPKQ